jgi:hypothetical protein
MTVSHVHETVQPLVQKEVIQPEVRIPPSLLPPGESWFDTNIHQVIHTTVP